MEPAASDWIKEAEDNLSTAKLLYENEKFKDSTYYCHQVAEKLLKAVQIEKLKKFDMVHDLTLLAKSVGAPRRIILDCERLTNYYISTKYPVLNRKLPAESAAVKNLEEAEEVIEWALSMLK